MFPSINNQNQTSNIFPNSNTLLRGNNDHAHQSFIKQLFGYTQECQRGQQLYWSLKILQNEYRNILIGIDECTKMDGNIGYDDQFNKQMRERCLKIKKDNDCIIMEMLNFKDQIAKLKANFIDKDVTKESQLNQIQDKIRKRKMDITGKLQKLRNNRKASKSKNGGKGNQKNRVQVVPTMKLALTELKDAVQGVSRELITQREEIRVLIKQLYDQEI